MDANGEKWIINIISLKDNTSYIICSDDEVKQNINELFDCNYNDGFIKKCKKVLTIQNGEYGFRSKIENYIP